MVQEKKTAAQFMNMSRYFIPLKDQRKLHKEFDKILKDEIQTEIESSDPVEMSAKYGSPHIIDQVDQEFKNRNPEVDLKVKQKSLLHEIAHQVNLASRQFDLDATQTTEESQFDKLVKLNVVQKSLESDNLLYVEGFRSEHQPEFLTQEQFLDEAMKDENQDDCISAGDFEEAFEEKFDIIEEKSKPKLGIFEKVEYFDKIFPSLKIQKPGYDLYGTTTTILAIMAIFVFNNF
jgi:hypothetical protein